MPCKLLIYSVYELPVSLTEDLFSERSLKWFVKVNRFDGNFDKVHFIVLQISFAGLADCSKHLNHLNYKIEFPQKCYV